jgi:AraC-like DNA-binding protein
MDYHKIENITVEQVKKAHLADEAVQDQYGVKYHQFWVNERDGAVFCLVEGPDKETCQMVHQLAHGNVACALTEVEPGYYEKLMGKDQRVDHGHVQKMDGGVDMGYRNIMVAAVYGITKATSSKEFSQLQRPLWARRIIAEKIDKFKGREVPCEIDDSIIGIFNETDQAINCALEIQSELIRSVEKEASIVFRIGLSASQPVTEKGNFFTDAIKLAHRLSVSAKRNGILASSLVRKLGGEVDQLWNPLYIKSLTPSEEEFLSNLLYLAEIKLSDKRFSLNNLGDGVYVSRPQLYRKITALTGRSPNDFMRDLRMDKAISLLKRNNSSIAEVAYEAGFNSPSYFTKCFSEKFGCTPSVFARS